MVRFMRDIMMQLFQTKNTFRFHIGFLVLFSESLAGGIESIDGCHGLADRKVREIRFEGLLKTRHATVERELFHHEGVRFDCARLERETRKLEGLGIFASVTPQAIPLTDSTVNLVFVFKEVPTHLPFISIKKSDRDGFSAGPAYLSPNLFGQAARLQAAARFGGTTEFLLLANGRWISDHVPLEYNAALIRVESENSFDGFFEESNRMVVELTYRAKPWFGALLAYEHYYLGADPTRPDLLLSNKGGDHVPRLGTGVIFDTRETVYNPTQGAYQEFRLTQHGGRLGGPANFQEVVSDTRGFQALGDKMILHGSTLYRYRTGKPGETIGLYDDFHLGGGNSLRGYAVNSTSGKSEVLTTVETRNILVSRRAISLMGGSLYYSVQAVLGTDLATTWDHAGILGGHPLSSVYTGAHLLLPGVDRIRFELGTPTTGFDPVFSIAIMEKSWFQRFRDR
jgi:outer membrane protein assembly factor BamA